MAKLKDGYYKQTAEAIGSDLYVLLAGGGSKALSDFATASGVVTALGTNGNYVTWTKNGTVNNLTVPYATNADTLDGLHASDFWNSKAGNLNVADIDVFTTRASGAYTVLHERHSSALFVFRDENYSWSSLSSLELYAPHYNISEGLKVRTSISNDRYSDWREVAFTDTSSLTPRSGTLSIDGVVKIKNKNTLYTNNILPSNGYSDWIGSKDTAFNIYTPNIILKNTYTRIQNNNLGRWFRILDLSECYNSSAIVSISKGYYNNPAGGTIFAVNANSYDVWNCMITVLSGNLGLIKKIRVVTTWIKSYVDVYIDNLNFDGTESYSISKIGEGTIVNFEPLEEAGGTVRAEVDITIGFSCSSSLYGAGLKINGTASITGDTTINGKLTATSLVEAINGFKGNLTGNAASASMLYRPNRLANVDYTADKIASFTHLIIDSIIGDNFPFPSGGSSILHMEWDSLHSYSKQLAVGAEKGINEPNNRLKWRAQNNGVWCDWKTVAFTDGNIASSTITGDDTMTIIPLLHNEINFGGTNNSLKIYFGYRATDSKPIPTSFIFGGSDGSASLSASKFIKSGGTAALLLRADGNVATFNWSGQNGQPTWLWGGDTQHTYYVYNPANFSVNYATSAGNADTLDGEHGSRYTLTLGGPNYVTITVEGDAATYYPVIIKSVSNKYPMLFVNISRGYSETAPDSWNNSTHKGGLTLTLLWNGSRYWDGNGSGQTCYCVYVYEAYCTMVGGLGNSTAGKVVWLRGGGAVYHIHAMNGTSVTADVHTSTYTDSAKLSFAPRTTVESYDVRWPGYSYGADKLGSSTIGGTYLPIYLSSGAATAGTSYAKAIKAITRSGTTFTYTCIDGTTGTFTQLDSNTTYPVYFKHITTGFKDAFRTQTKGDSNNGGYIAAIRCNKAYVADAPQDSSGIAFGMGDTHGYLYTNYGAANAFIGGGNGNKLNWIKQLAFIDSNITGNAATATKLQTARKLWGLDFNGTLNVTGNMNGVGTINNRLLLDGSGNAQVHITGVTANTDYIKLQIDGANNNGRNLILQTDGGNVGIGTDSPLYKLHVAGTTSTNLLFIGGSSHPMIIGNGSLLSLGAADSNSKASVVLDLNTDSFRRNSASTTISLGTAAYPWTNIYGDTITIKNYKNFINGNISYPNVDDSYKMGTDLGLISFIGDNGNDTGLGITWSFNTTSAHAGIYTKLSGTYGSKMYFATTNAFSHGPKAALEIDHEGNIKALRGKFIGNLNHTLTFSTGKFAANTYNNSAAVTVNVPTHTSHLTNDSGFLTAHLSLANYVTLNSALTITGLKTFESNSSTTGVSLILKNKAWTSGMSTAMDFYNGSDYNVPNARIETKMVGNGTSGGTLIFYTQTKHASTNPNPNGLTERMRIDDNDTIRFESNLLTKKLIILTDNNSYIRSSSGNIIVGAGTSSRFAGGFESTSIIVGGSNLPTIIRTSADNLYHYRGDTNTRYSILDTGNSSVSGGGSNWGSSITINLGGTSKTLTIPSKPSYSWTDISNKPVYSWSGSSPLDIILANYGTMATNLFISAYLSHGSGSIAMGYKISGYESTPYGGWFGATYSSPWFIGASAGTWTLLNIITDTNYTSYTVKKDGTGASGTWGINITGNAATATSSTKSGSSDWLNTNTKLEYGASGLNYFNFNGTAKNDKSNCTPEAGYYHILRMNHANTRGYLVDIAAPLNNVNGIYWRQIRNGVFYGWYKLIDDNNYSSILDSRYYTETEVNNKLAGYLPLSGGTLTGDVTISKESARYIVNNSSGTYKGFFGLSGNDTLGIWSATLSEWLITLYSNNIILANLKKCNVGIRNSVPTCALDVTGAIKASEGITVSGTSDFSSGTIKFDTINIPTTSGGSTYGPGANGQVLKSNGSTVYWANDNNSYGYIGTTSVQSSSKAQSLTGIVNITASGIIYTNTIKFTNSNADQFDAISFNNNSICIGVKSDSNITDSDFYEGGIKINSGYYNTEVSCNSFIVNSSITASGDITAYSDRRLKSNIKPLENRGYIQPMTYIKDNKECIGFIAQDVLEKYPELVNDNSEYLSLNYLQYVAVLQALIIELEKRVKELENGTRKL